MAPAGVILAIILSLMVNDIILTYFMGNLDQA